MRGSKYLMHGQDKVALLNFSDGNELTEIKEIYNEELMPPGCTDLFSTLRWLLCRSLATNRKDLMNLRDFYGSRVFSSENGMSLFDNYWFTSSRKDIPDWEKINAFDNWDPSDDFLNMIFLHPEMSRRLFLMEDFSNTPNFTMPGTEPRLWYRTQGKLAILNRNAREDMALWKSASVNEDHRRLVSRRYYVILGEYIYTLKYAQTSKDLEYIPFLNYYHATARKELSDEDNIKITCERYDLPDWENYFTSLVSFDRTVGNKNRELSDIGVLRNTKTLEPISFSSL